ncbi:FACT complex subunit POB3 [Cucumispora dikerogammari]|nr:FACT complex subunit POB3 [Cucumispora dikerogammari]
MSVLTFDQLFLYNKTTPNSDISVKMSPEGIAIKQLESGDIISIPKETLQKIRIFYGLKEYNLQIQAEEDYNIFGIDEPMKDSIIKVFDEWYDKKIINVDLDVENTLSGKLECLENTIVYKTEDKPIFEIEKKDIIEFVELKGDISISLPLKKNSVSEIRMTCDENFLQNLKSSTNIETKGLYIIKNVRIAYPRGRNDIIFYTKYFKVIGYTYEHKIPYNSIGKIHFLEKKDGHEMFHYFICHLKVPIKQGVSLYDYIAFMFQDDEELEVECINFDEAKKTFDNIKPAYDDSTEKVFKTLISIFCDRKIEKSDAFQTTEENNYISCSLRAYSGTLHFIEKYLIFLPKVIIIDINDITGVEFARINISAATVKTLDMKVMSEAGNFDFNSINKEHLGILEKYFAERNVKMSTEEIQDISDEDTEYADSQISDMGNVSSD